MGFLFWASILAPTQGPFKKQYNIRKHEQAKKDTATRRRFAQEDALKAGKVLSDYDAWEAFPDPKMKDHFKGERFIGGKKKGGGGGSGGGKEGGKRPAGGGGQGGEGAGGGGGGGGEGGHDGEGTSHGEK